MSICQSYLATRSLKPDFNEFTNKAQNLTLIEFLIIVQIIMHEEFSKGVKQGNL